MKILKILFLTSIVLVSCNNNNEEINEGPEEIIELPTLQTYEVVDISLYSVTLGGKILNHGSSDVIEKGFVIGITSMPTLESNYDKIIINSESPDEFFLRLIDGIPGNRRYYIRTYGINSEGISYGNEVGFTAPYEKIYEGDVHLSSQNEVIEFGLNNYTTINGNVYISGSVTNLSPLNTWVMINGRYYVEGTTELINFEGLENLKSTGHFKISNNLLLENFMGLSSLEITDGDFGVINNINLQNLKGMVSLTTASAGELRIERCEKIISLEGLEGLTFIGWRLVISENENLIDISALGNLRHIGNRIYIQNNQSLSNLNGLENITSLEAIEILYNSVLSDLSGISNLTTVTEGITIRGNSSLSSLSAFLNITEIDYINIEGNNNISNLSGFDNLTSIGKKLVINDNLGLTSLNGLEKLSSVESLEIIRNNSLNNILGLNSLVMISGNTYSISIGYNSNLKKLDGLENLLIVDGYIQIFNNLLLNDFCGLKPLFEIGTHNGDLAITENLENPTITEIINNCE